MRARGHGAVDLPKSGPDCNVDMRIGYNSLISLPGNSVSLTYAVRLSGKYLIFNISREGNGRPTAIVLCRFMSVANQYSLVSPAQPGNQLFGPHLLRHSVTSTFTSCFIMIFISLHFALFVIFTSLCFKF